MPAMNAKLVSLSLLLSLDFSFRSFCLFYLFACQCFMSVIVSPLLSFCSSYIAVSILQEQSFSPAAAQNLWFPAKPFFFYFMFTLLPSSFPLSLLCSASQSIYMSSMCSTAVILVSSASPLPVTVLEGHCWYNYSFWLSSRLTPGWPGPDAAPVCQPLLLLQLMRDA